MGEWIDYNDKWYKFKHTKFNKAGVLIEIDDGLTLLIGDINRDGGECNCCTNVEYENVIRFKVVYSEDE